MSRFSVPRGLANPLTRNSSGSPLVSLRRGKKRYQESEKICPGYSKNSKLQAASTDCRGKFPWYERTSFHALYFHLVPFPPF